MIVVSNTSPLRYLITVTQSNLIQNLFGHVLIPRAVEAELTHRSAPTVVRQWMTLRPRWIEVRDLEAPPEPGLIRRLGEGEAEAIQLAIDVKADALIMDERSGRSLAATRRIQVWRPLASRHRQPTTTPGVPDIASFGSSVRRANCINKPIA